MRRSLGHFEEPTSLKKKSGLGISARNYLIITVAIDRRKERVNGGL